MTRLYNDEVIVVVMMMGTGPSFFAPDTPFGSLFSGAVLVGTAKALVVTPAALQQQSRRSYNQRIVTVRIATTAEYNTAHSSQVYLRDEPRGYPECAVTVTLADDNRLYITS